VRKRHHHPLAAEGSGFPPPWYVEEQDTCFVVRDHSGRALARVYFSVNDSWPPDRPSKFTHEEAEQIAASAAKLTELLKTDQWKKS
jgi:hypothetical protein